MFSDNLLLLNEVELEFEAGDELLLFFDLIFGFEDEVGGGFVDVVGVLYTEVESI